MRNRHYKKKVVTRLPNQRKIAEFSVKELELESHKLMRDSGLIYHIFRNIFDLAKSPAKWKSRLGTIELPAFFLFLLLVAFFVLVFAIFSTNPNFLSSVLGNAKSIS